VVNFRSPKRPGRVRKGKRRRENPSLSLAEKGKRRDRKKGDVSNPRGERYTEQAAKAGTKKE